MSEFSWDNSLKIGVDAMDEQHKILIELINKLVQTIESGSDAMDDFDNLADYVVKHFSEEEDYLEKINFPQLEGHKKIHEDLVEKLSAYHSQMKNGTLDTTAFFGFLKVWLTSHIKGIDAQYGEFANQE
jgi:hemerythrin